MKKPIVVFLIILVIIAITVVVVAAFNSNSIKRYLSEKKQKSTDNISVGGWTKVSSPIITDELRAAFEKAAGELTGMSYEPVAYLETQLVAGRNYLVLCKGTATVPNAKPYYSLLKIYERLDGVAEITSMTDSVIPAVVTEDIDGGWTVPDTPEVTAEAKKALENASKTLTGAEYRPVALLGTQVVSGTNYVIFCEMKATVPNGASDYAFVYVYEDLKGNAQITDTKQFNQPDTTPTRVDEEQTATTNEP